MPPGINYKIFYGETLAYAEYAMRLSNCKWYEFVKKRTYKDLMELLYPMVKNQLKSNMLVENQPL